MASGTGQRSTPWTDYKGLSDDVIVSRQIKILLSSYRRDDYADPDGFITQLSALFERQPRNVIVEVTNPLNTRSIQRKHPTYPPNIGEVAAALEAEAEEQAKIAAALARPRPVLSHPYEPRPSHDGCWANVFVGPESPNYQAVLEWTKGSGIDRRSWRDGEFRGIVGIWIALPNYESLRGTRPGGAKQIGTAALRAQIGRAEAELNDSSSMFDPPSEATS